jgi:hypothetical protein
VIELFLFFLEFEINQARLPIGDNQIVKISGYIISVTKKKAKFGKKYNSNLTHI